ncbi:MAG: J domain-containing protein [Chloroflexi bacterium]|nr:J domain-containing protein [Chloroflexota bacterium]
MEFRDYYATLGVARTASQAEIKKAFRKLARVHHPDVKPNDKAAERRFKDINEANAVLSDPGKRAQYDTLGPDWESVARAGAGHAGRGASAAGGAGPFAGFGGGNVRYEFRTTGDASGFSDFFRTFFSGDARDGGPSGSSTRARTTNDATFEEILAGMGLDAAGSTPATGATGGAGRRPSSGRGGSRTAGAGAGRHDRDLEATVDVTLEEAYNGTTRLVEIDGKRLEVTIPRGVDAGSRIRLAGRGGDGRDLYLVTSLRPHPTFTRRGADLEREVPVTLREALLGAEVPVGTLRGRVLLTVPARTQNGRTFRLSGQGMPRLSGDGIGDLYVRIRIVLPTRLSSEAEDAARRFLELVEQPDPRVDAT